MKGLTMLDRQIVFVLGMGRSGTSVMARVLSLCGALLPEPLLGAGEGNPTGHWEPIDALKLNDAFLSRHGATWYDPTLRLQGEVRFDDQEREAFVRRILAFLEACPIGAPVIIKEPRITALSDFWLEANRRAGFTAKSVMSIRHPDQVAASLAARDGVSIELSSVLWLKYSLLAERRSRGLQRVFVEYSNLLEDWRREVGRISESLRIDFSPSDEATIDQFVDRELHRQKYSGEPSDLFGQSWTADAYTALSAAARDVPLNTRTLDAIFSSFTACERTFRVSLEEFHTRFGPSGLNVLE
jgi:hypothetical protein